MYSRATQGVCGLPAVAIVTVLCGVFAMVPPVRAGGAGEGAVAVGPPVSVHPFSVEEFVPRHGVVKIEVTPGAYEVLKHGPAEQVVAWPVNRHEHLTLELERFEVTTPQTRFVIVTHAGEVAVPAPDVVLLRGGVRDEPGSRAFIALTGEGGGNGYVTLGSGEQYSLSRSPGLGGSGLTIHRASGAGVMPDVPRICGLDDAPSLEDVGVRMGERTGPLPGGPRVAVVAVDADQSFANLFASPFEPQGYVVQVFGAVSDIYIRDLDVKLQLGLVRIWMLGGEPFSADDLYGFANYWQFEDDPTPYDLIHLFSGRRDLPYGGVAFVSGVCSTSAYGISGFLLGSFPTPMDGPDLGNWDLVVSAHEMGHNMGSFHTHDGFSPPIDQCGDGIHSRSTILSYCHITAGGLLNIEMRFHALVQEVIAADVEQGDCLWYDCNDNDVDDVDDLSIGTSSDTNGNGIPDECEDCNENGVLDDADILGGAPDVDGNGLPDECEPDCDSDGVPDEHQIALELAPDENGNLVPDGCEPDCNDNGTPDFVEIAADGDLDIDRSGGLDACQDCDGNGTTDWIDVEREFNVYVGELSDFVREYHAVSGVAIQNLAAGIVVNPYDLTFGPDRRLYVASHGNDRIVRIDVDTGAAVDFVPAGSGGLDGPAGLTFGGNGNLFVSSNLTSSVMEYDGGSGALIGAFVTSGSGGLANPYGLEFGPNGNLFVTSSNNSVLEYAGVDGSFVGAHVSPGSGGLNGPRGIAFKPDGNLLVASHYTHEVLEYDSTGGFWSVFNGEYAATGAWGVRIGPNGNVFVVRHSGTIRVIEYDVTARRYVRSFIRGDASLVSPTGLAFRPASPFDCNLNRLPDTCDVGSGASLDCQPNGVPDECDIADGTSPDDNTNGVPDECDALPPTPEPGPACEDAKDCGGAHAGADCVGGMCYAPKNRYLTIDPTVNFNEVAYQVEIADAPDYPTAVGRTWWVDTPSCYDYPNGDVVPGATMCEGPDVFGWVSHVGATPVTRIWTETPVHISDCGIVPNVLYEVRSSLDDGGSFSEALAINTAHDPDGEAQSWGDITGGPVPGLPGLWLAPEGTTNLADVQNAIRTFENRSEDTGSPPRVWVDVEIDHVVNLADVQFIVNAFEGKAYADLDDLPLIGWHPADCP